MPDLDLIRLARVDPNFTRKRFTQIHTQKFESDIGSGPRVRYVLPGRACFARSLMKAIWQVFSIIHSMKAAWQVFFIIHPNQLMFFLIMTAIQEETTTEYLNITSSNEEFDGS